jgi:hypothetical protein
MGTFPPEGADEHEVATLAAPRHTTSRVTGRNIEDGA